MASKSRSNLSENPNKASLATPRVSKTSKVVSKSQSESPSPLQNSRLSVDRSPRSVNSKPAVERKSPRPTSTPPDKQPPRAVKGSELQNQLNLAQEDLKKAKEQLIQAEKEKVKAIEELKAAQKVAEEANEKLREALVAQKRAEEDSEIEKFRAVELEQAGIETVKKKEEEWQKEIESVKNQHALDVAALLSTTEELQRVKLELAKTCDAKNQALSHADDATKIAEIHAEKVEFLSAELMRLKGLLDSKLETEASENEFVSKLKTEIDALKQELEKAKGYGEKLTGKETEIEALKQDLDEKLTVKETEIEALKQELEKAKGYDEKLTERETEIETLKQELGKAKGYDEKLAEKETEMEALKQEIEKAKGYYDEKLTEKETEMEALKQELEGYDEKLTEKETEIEALKQELEKAKVYAEKLIEKEACIEQLNVELEASKMAESYAHSLLKEWKKKVDELEMRVQEANKLERSASESLESVLKQLEGSNDLLHDAESEVATLKEKVGLLEMTIGRQRADLEDSERRLLTAKEESLDKSKKVESLQIELETVKEEKVQALENEKLAASSVQTLLEEKNKLINELENSRDEEEKSKRAMESLASALHEVSAEAREARENLLISQAERESYETQIEDMKLVLKATNEKYESMLDEARHEIDVLIGSIENSKNVFENSKAEWEQKELHLVGSLKKTEEENASLEKEINRLAFLLKETEDEASAGRHDEALLKENLKEVEAETIHLQEALKEATAESQKLKENLLDKENELQSIIQENDELRARETESIKKVEELSKLLEEATTRNHNEENGDLTDSEKDYDLLPKVVEFSEENGHGGEDISKVELSVNNQEGLKRNLEEEGTLLNDEAEKIESPKHNDVNGNLKEDESKEKDELADPEFKMWESCKIEKKEFSPEREPEPESFEEEVDSKTEGGESFDKINGTSTTENIDDGGSSPKQQQLKKKKKPLLGKFGSLLKKKGASNQK